MYDKRLKLKEFEEQWAASHVDAVQTEYYPTIPKDPGLAEKYEVFWLNQNKTLLKVADSYKLKEESVETTFKQRLTLTFVGFNTILTVLMVALSFILYSVLSLVVGPVAWAYWLVTSDFRLANWWLSLFDKITSYV